MLTFPVSFFKQSTSTSSPFATTPADSNFTLSTTSFVNDTAQHNGATSPPYDGLKKTTLVFNETESAEFIIDWIAGNIHTASVEYFGICPENKDHEGPYTGFGSVLYQSHAWVTYNLNSVEVAIPPGTTLLNTWEGTFGSVRRFKCVYTAGTNTVFTDDSLDTYTVTGALPVGNYTFNVGFYANHASNLPKFKIISCKKL